jgi:hypothetical protein
MLHGVLLFHTVLLNGLKELKGKSFKKATMEEKEMELDFGSN